jgi:Putative metallopeptidase
MTFASPTAFLLILAIFAVLFMLPQTSPMAAESQPNRIRIEYVPPTNPAHQSLYELLKQHRTLEKLQEVFSPFKLPIDLTLRTVGCNGISNAWYHRPDVSVCYEYLSEIYATAPKEPTPGGITPHDTVLGQTFYVFGHEMGHAMFDMLNVPIFGDAENAADHFSGYMMLQFGKDQAKGLPTRTRNTSKVPTYRRRLPHSPTSTLPLRNASTICSALPMARTQFCSLSSWKRTQ